MKPVIASFLRMSATRKAVRIVVSTPDQVRGTCRRARRARRRLSVTDDAAGATGRLDRLACAGTEAMGEDRQRLGDRALGEHLDVDVLALREALGLHRLDRHLVAAVEAPLEVLQVD